MRWPDDKRFAFTIVDDTDESTLAGVKPIYDLLDELGMRITKTVWPLRADPGTRWETSDTLQDGPYLDYVRHLRGRGFEIALHGVRGCTSTREQVIEGLDVYRELIGAYPNIHVNHAQNEDNLYWGRERVAPWKRFLRHYDEYGSGYGHIKGNECFWGDICKEHISYVRGPVFGGINTLAQDPLMPYHDPRFPWVNQWFSSSDGAYVSSFTSLLARENVARLSAEGGACIVYTHFGSDFVRKGKVDPAFESRLRALASENGWFAPASTILDHLASSPPRRLRTVARTTLWWRQRRDRPISAGVGIG